MITNIFRQDTVLHNKTALNIATIIKTICFVYPRCFIGIELTNSGETLLFEKKNYNYKNSCSYLVYINLYLATISFNKSWPPLKIRNDFIPSDVHTKT